MLVKAKKIYTQFIPTVVVESLAIKNGVIVDSG